MFQLSDYDKIIVYYDKPEQKGVYAAYVADNDDDEDFPEDPLDIGLLHLTCIFKLSEDGKNWENLGVILENSNYDDDECYDMDFDYDFVGNIFKLKENELPEFITMKKVNLLGQNVYVNSSLDERDLYNTPSSVTLFNSKQLSIKSDNHLEGLLGQISNLNYASGTSRPRYFQIRGIGERSHYAGEGPPNYSVGFLVDGIDFSGIGMVGHLFDVNQIEVFKGPQSTVFGPNAVAGSINIKSAHLDKEIWSISTSFSTLKRSS